MCQLNTIYRNQDSTRICATTWTSHLSSILKINMQKLACISRCFTGIQCKRMKTVTEQKLTLLGIQ